MASDPYAAFSTPVAAAPANDPYAGVASLVHPMAQQGPQADWQSQVKPVTTFNGKPSVQRPDGGVWYGPEQGNTGTPGWFDAKGSRLGDANGQVPGFIHGAVVGLKNAGEAAVQSFMDMPNPDLPPSVDIAHKPIVDQIDAAIAQRTAARNATVSGMMGKLGKFAGEAVPVVAGTVALGEPTVGNWAQRGAQAGLQAAGPAAALTPGSQQDKAIAGAASIPLGMAGEGATTALSKALPALKDSTLAAVRRMVAGDAEQRAAGAGILANAADQGVDLPTSTVVKASVQPAAEVTQARQAVQAFSNDLKQQTANTPFSGLADVQKAAAGTGKRTVAANSLLDSINNAGTDAHDLVQTSAGLQAFREKMRMDQLFSLRDELAQGVNVDPSKPISVLDGFIKDANGVDGSKWPQKDAAIARLSQLRDNLANITKETPTGLLDESGNPITRTVDTPNTFKAMAKTRSDLGDAISDYFTGTDAEIGKKGAGALQATKQAIDDAMSDAAQSSGKPALAQADKLARSEYSNYAGTFRDPTVVKAIQTSDPDQVVQALTKAGTDKAQRIFDALEPKGQAAFAQASWEDAIRQATNKRTGDWIPGNVSGGISDHMKALGVTMPAGGQNAWRLNGINNLMQTLAKVNPEQASALGQRITESAMKATSLTDAVLKLLNTVKDGSVDMFFNNKAGKQFLYDAATAKPNSPAMFKLIQTNFPKVLAASAASSTSPKPSQEPNP